MRVKPYQKGIVFGILTALVTVSVIVGAYYGTILEREDYLIPPFEWDFSSPAKLSLQMSNRSEYLLAFSVRAKRLSQGWGGMVLPYFNYSVHSISSWYLVEDEKQILLLGDYLNNDTRIETFHIINQELLVPIGIALAKDLQTMGNFTNIAENYLEEEYAAIEEGGFSFWITHIYRDGSYIHIRTVENIVFIRFARFTRYIGEYHVWGVDLDIDEFEDGTDKYEEVYKATIPEIFTNHTTAVNVFLDYFY